MTQSLVTVVLFVLAILSIPFLLKRWQEKRGGLLPGAPAAGPGAKLVSAVAVGPQQRVVTVEVGPEGARTQLVLGVTAQSITCLHTLDVSAAAAASASPSFPRRDPKARMPDRSVPSRSLATAAALLALALLAPSAQAQETGGQLPLLIGQGAGGTNFSVPVQTLLFFTALSFLPAIVLMMTGFTRIVIVLSLMRQALGTQSAPPNQVVIGLSLFLTFFVMGPTLDRVYAEAYKPYTENTIGFEAAIAKAEAPMRDFMLKQTRQSDFALFARLAQLPAGTTAQTAPMRVLIPAFATSELKTAFQIGFMIFIPFLVIDIVVSSVLMSLGMMMLSPVLVALPFKLMLFVLADGWNLLIGSLAASFAR